MPPNKRINLIKKKELPQNKIDQVEVQYCANGCAFLQLIEIDFWTCRISKNQSGRFGKILSRLLDILSCWLMFLYYHVLRIFLLLYKKAV